MRHAATASNPRFRGPARSVALIAPFLALGLLAGCGSDSSVSSDSSDAVVATTAVDPGPGPTTFDATIQLAPAVTGLDDPVALVARPMRNQLWIAERSGRVRVVTRDTEWDLAAGKVQRTGYTLEPEPVLDVSQLTSTDGSRGLRSLAFSTDGQTLYVQHSGRDGAVIVARYTVTDPLDFSGAPAPPTVAPSRAAADPTGSTTTLARSAAPSSTAPGPIGRPDIDPGTRVVLITVAHDQETPRSGGHLALGPDGYLYISTGGTGTGIAPEAAQDPNSLHGKILRIDPTIADGDRPYSIPSDNPFADGGGAPEVWAMGLRNPRLFSFDRTSGNFWIGDTGQDQLEEIDVIARGSAPMANLGWPLREGDQPNPGSTDTGTTAFSELTEPVLVYPHTEGRCEVVGGYVYRGSAVPGLDGVYLYADFCTGELRGLLSRRAAILTDKRLNASIDPSILRGFGQDDQGELYTLTTTGTLSVIVNAQ
jgi:glucose/arabinose dehydrogenase